MKKLLAVIVAALMLGSFAVTAAVLHFQLPFFQQRNDLLLAFIAGVVTSNPNFHVLLTPLS